MASKASYTKDRKDLPRCIDVKICQTRADIMSVPNSRQRFIGLPPGARLDFKRRGLPNRSLLSHSGAKNRKAQEIDFKARSRSDHRTPHPAIRGALKSRNAPPVIFQEGRFCRDVSINAGVFSKNAGAIVDGHQMCVDIPKCHRAPSGAVSDSTI